MDLILCSYESKNSWNPPCNMMIQKPEMNHFYNHTEDGIDTFVQLCGNYNVGEQTSKICLSF